MFKCYFRIQLPLEEAKERFSQWKAEKKIVVQFVMTPPDQWEGGQLRIYQKGSWTVFEDHSYQYFFLSPDVWRHFVQKNSFLFAGYDIHARIAEILAIQKGVLSRRFVQCEDMPEEYVNFGMLDAEERKRIISWRDVPSLVNGDPYFT